jgi:hypothetical protein
MLVRAGTQSGVRELEVLSYFKIVFSVLTGFSVNLSANWQAVEIIWE